MKHQLLESRLLLSICAGMAVCMAHGAATAQAYHDSDINLDFRINLSELLRNVQLYNVGAYHCEASTEDGYAPLAGPSDCAPHSADTDGSWGFTLSELLRVIQFYNIEAYHSNCLTSDSFAPGEGARQECAGVGLSLYAGTRNLYIPGEMLTVTMTINRDFTENPNLLSAVGVLVEFPNGDWTFDNVSAGSVPIAVQHGTLLNLAWVGVPYLPFTFSYTVYPSASLHGPQDFDISLVYRLDGGSLELDRSVTIQEGAPGSQPGVGDPVECPSISFWNVHLYAAVHDSLGNPPDGVTVCDADDIESLDAADYGIAYLNGLGILSALRQADFSDNIIYDIAGIAETPSLEVVNLANNAIRHLDQLLTMNPQASLQEIDLRGNPLEQSACDVIEVLESRGITVLHDLNCD